MGRVLTGVNHPIETDRGLWARAGWSRGENEDSSGEMTRTETDSEHSASASQVWTETQVNTASPDWE